jgi:hypothetical protein
MSQKIVSMAAVAAAAAAAVFTLANAQAPQRPLTVEDRVAALERQVATLDTRAGLNSTALPGGANDRDYALTSRIDQLQQAMDRLATDVQRVERLADNAARDASQAQREAMYAQQAARDAANRIR